MSWVILLVGLLIRLVAQRQIGKEYSPLLVKPEKFVKTGLYKYIRHPMYLGNMILILGASLIHPVFGIMLIAWSFYYSRIVIEDTIMFPHNGEYIKNTGMLLPRRKKCQ